MGFHKCWGRFHDQDSFAESQERIQWNTRGRGTTQKEGSRLIRIRACAAAPVRPASVIHRYPPRGEAGVDPRLSLTGYSFPLVALLWLTVGSADCGAWGVGRGAAGAILQVVGLDIGAA